MKYHPPDVSLVKSWGVMERISPKYLCLCSSLMCSLISPPPFPAFSPPSSIEGNKSYALYLTEIKINYLNSTTLQWHPGSKLLPYPIQRALGSVEILESLYVITQCDIQCQTKLASIWRLTRALPSHTVIWYSHRCLIVIVFS